MNRGHPTKSIQLRKSEVLIERYAIHRPENRRKIEKAYVLEYYDIVDFSVKVDLMAAGIKDSVQIRRGRELVEKIDFVLL